ncbi:type II secretion system F family protein [Nocardia aurantiaca]|uniref:Type II secretion system F family protein n=1 Tax=Nocardia aurantiaca TaxID=2675850 RepID=A0A6I3KW43_9NOCA|nr:type II secretion system F family protein [Nocardia aurantiaca]MTE12264.1 type II secretion system F family protein [Nocardia aurantiaca]
MTPSLAAVLAAIALLMLPGRVGAVRRLHRLRDASSDNPLPQPTSRAVPDPLGVASALDLLAACLRAGLPTASAAAAVATEAPEPLASALRRAADLLALGADPVSAWEQAIAGAADESVTALARMARRSARSGTGLATAVGELAERRRGELEDAAVARSERAGVLIGGPLGLCFLPAFLCLGIVPVVIGLAGRVLDGGLL